MTCLEQVQSQWTSIFKVDVKVIAVEQRRAEQRTLAHCKHCNIQRLSMPENGCCVNVNHAVAVIGEIGADTLVKRQV